MTRREIDTFHQSDCPCGKGEIVRRVESTDYHHTSVRVSYSLECDSCSALWRLEYGHLVLRSSELPYISAKAEHDIARTELYKLSNLLVKEYFKGRSFKSKKAELEHLKSIGICESTYESYLRGRREREIYEMAYGLRNISWLTSVAATAGKEEDLLALVTANDISTKRADAAYKLIERRPFLKTT